MGRNKVMIPFNPDRFKDAIHEKGWTQMRVGHFLGVSKQAVNGWCNEERIPPRKLADLSTELELSAKTVAEILDKQESVKDLARENARLRDENYRLKQAIQALTDLDQPKPAGDVE